MALSRPKVFPNVYVDNMCAKFQGQKIHMKKDIQNLPTCVVVRMIFSAFGIVSFCGLKFDTNVNNQSHNDTCW